MKKISILLNFILLGLLIWCWTCCHQEHEALEHLVSHSHAPGKLCDSCCQTPSTESFELNNPDVIAMVSKYTTDHWQKINSFYPCMRDSRCMWFSLSRLKGFIQEIETKSSTIMAAGKDTCCQTLGIRIYLAEYTDTQMIHRFFQGDGSAYDNYLNKTTIVMVPTFRCSADKKDHDFNPNYYYNDPTKTFQCCPNVTDTLQWSVPLTALTMNHGGIIPPPYPSVNAIDPNLTGNDRQIYQYSGADFMVQMVDRVYSGPPHPNPYYGDGTPPCTAPNNNWFDYQ